MGQISRERSNFITVILILGLIGSIVMFCCVYLFYKEAKPYFEFCDLENCILLYAALWFVYIVGHALLLSWIRFGYILMVIATCIYPIIQVFLLRKVDLQLHDYGFTGDMDFIGRAEYVKVLSYGVFSLVGFMFLFFVLFARINGVSYWTAMKQYAKAKKTISQPVQNDVQTIYCPNCGFNNASSSNFCSSCGSQLPPLANTAEQSDGQQE